MKYRVPKMVFYFQDELVRYAYSYLTTFSSARSATFSNNNKLYRQKTFICLAYFAD